MQLIGKRLYYVASKDNIFARTKAQVCKLGALRTGWFDQVILIVFCGVRFEGFRINVSFERLQGLFGFVTSLKER